MSWSPPRLLDLMWVCINLLSSPGLVLLLSFQTSFLVTVCSSPGAWPPALCWQVRAPLPRAWLCHLYKGSHLVEALSPFLAVKSLASTLT